VSANTEYDLVPVGSSEMLPYQEPQASTGITLRDVLYVFFRHKWKMLFFFVLVFTGGAFAIFLMPDVYESRSQVIVKTGRNPLTKDPLINAPAAETTVRNEMAIMSSRILAERVVAELGPDFILRRPEPKSPIQQYVARLTNAVKRLEKVEKNDPAFQEFYRNAAVDLLMRNVSISERSGATTLEITYNALDPEVAQNTLSAFVNLFLKRHIEVHRAAIQPEFFEGEAQKTYAAFEKKQKELSDFCERNNVNAFEKQQEELVKAHSDLGSKRREAESQIKSSEAKIRVFDEQLTARKKDSIGKTPEQPATKEEEGDLATAVTPESPLLASLKNELVNLQKKEAQLARKYTEGERLLLDVRDEIHVTEEMIKKEEAAVADKAKKVADSIKRGRALPGVMTPLVAQDPVLQQVEQLLVGEKATLTGLQAAEVDYTKSQADIEGKMVAMRGLQTEYEKLLREKTTLEESYMRYLQDKERSEVSRTMDEQMVSNVEVFQPASYPLKPVTAQKARNLAVVLAAALFGSIALAFGLDFLSQTFKTNEDVERYLGVPVLTTVSDKVFERCI
jgi:uncharacterized protein involved in exopolysaccharide biosynthesis